MDSNSRCQKKTMLSSLFIYSEIREKERATDSHIENLKWNCKICIMLNHLEPM